MSLLGKDLLGFELARKLESHGVWRVWFGEPLYTNSKFCQNLLSPTTWASFMQCDESKSRADILLQLRARALLFDKAAPSLLLSSSIGSAAPTSSFSVSKLNPNYLQMHADDVYYTLENIDISNSMELSQFSDQDDFPETWYSQFISKVDNPYKPLVSDRKSAKRTPEEMSSYLETSRHYKKRRAPMGSPSSLHCSGSLENCDKPFFPESSHTLNCVPESAVPSVFRTSEINPKEIRGILDEIPQMKNHMVIERLGISAEHLRRNKKTLSQDQVARISQKVVARVLAQVGFESALEIPLEVVSQFMQSHFGKLGRVLRILVDSYRWEMSALELIKMFLQCAGCRDLGALMDLMKMGLQPQSSGYRLPNQSVMRKTPHNDIEKVKVKLENGEVSAEGNTFNLLQLRQQQLTALSNANLRQMHPQNMGMVRAPPVKVEGFQELMGGDASDDKLTSPSTR